VEPVPETAEALDRLADLGDTGLRTELARMGSVVRRLVPECIGLSLSVVRDDLTFTLVATDDEVASLDAVQYLDGGPCVDAAQGGREVVETRPEELLDEGRWRWFARASCASRVESTLSLPIGGEEQVVGGVNLYAATKDAFVGHHEELASALGAWAPGIVTNADLSFSTRVTAAEAPGRIAGQHDVDLAIGILAEAQTVSLVEATSRLKQAAARAGITELQVARLIVDVLRPT
jgi:hypothetical protein